MTKKRTTKKKTYAEVHEVFTSKGYTLLETNYKNSKQKLRYVCKKHPDEEQSIRFNDIASGHGCRFCGRERINKHIQERAIKQRHAYKDVEKTFKERGYILLSKEYTSATQKLKYVCPKHSDKKLSIRYSDLLAGNGCRYCAIEARKTPLVEVEAFFKERGYTLLSKKYKNNQTPLKFRCPHHPNENTSITLDSLKSGHGCSYCGIDKISGKNSVHYNHKIPIEDRRKDRRYDERERVWRAKVFKRYGYTCAVCGSSKSGTLNAHHKDGYNWCVERRYDLSNGVTLCVTCHTEFHSIYGSGDNTEKQYLEWLGSKKKQKRGIRE